MSDLTFSIYFLIKHVLNNNIDHSLHTDIYTFLLLCRKKKDRRRKRFKLWIRSFLENLILLVDDTSLDRHVWLILFVSDSSLDFFDYFSVLFCLLVCFFSIKTMNCAFLLWWFYCRQFTHLCTYWRILQIMYIVEKLSNSDWLYCPI